MKIPEPGEHSHGKDHKTDRDWSKHLKEGANHLRDHHKEERREPDRSKSMKGDR